MRSDRSTLTPATWAALLVSAAVVGFVLPGYVGAVGYSIGKLAIIPAALILLFALCLSRLWLLLAIIGLRATTELVFDSSRLPLGGAEIGLGGLMNGVAILIVLMIYMEKPERFSRELVTTWAAFLGMVFFGVAITVDRGGAIRLTLQLLSDVAIFAGGFYVVQSHKHFRACVLLIVASSVLPSLYGLAEYLGGFAEYYPDAGIRVKSTFSHPNVFGFYLTVVITLAFYTLKSRLFVASRIVKSLGFLYLMLLFVMLLLTKTRSAWVATAMVFVGYGVLFERRYLVYLVLAAFAALLVPGVADRLLDFQTASQISSSAPQNSLEWRKELWGDAFYFMAPGRYVSGYGLASFPAYAPTFFREAGGNHWAAHSVFVQLIFELGIPGLLAFLWIFGHLVHRFLSLRAIDRFGTYILVITAAEYLVECYSDNMLDYLSFNWYVWFLFGAALALVVRGKSKPDDIPATVLPP